MAADFRPSVTAHESAGWDCAREDNTNKASKWVAEAAGHLARVLQIIFFNLVIFLNKTWGVAQAGQQGCFFVSS